MRATALAQSEREVRRGQLLDQPDRCTVDRLVDQTELTFLVAMSWMVQLLWTMWTEEKKTRMLEQVVLLRSRGSSRRRHGGTQSSLPGQ